MISSDFVIRHALILTWVLILKEALSNFIFQRRKILFRFILSVILTGRNLRLSKRLMLIVALQIVFSMWNLKLLLILLFILLALFLLVSCPTRSTRSIYFIIIFLWILVWYCMSFTITLHKVLISAARNPSCRRLLWELWGLSGVKRRLRRRMEKWGALGISVSKCILLWCAHLL